MGDVAVPEVEQVADAQHRPGLLVDAGGQRRPDWTPCTVTMGIESRTIG